MIDYEDYKTQFEGEIIRYSDSTGIIDELRKEPTPEAFVQALRDLTHIRFCLPKPEPYNEKLIRTRLTKYLSACKSHIMKRFSVDLLVGFEAKARQACLDRPLKMIYEKQSRSSGPDVNKERISYAAEKRKKEYAEDDDNALNERR